MFVKVIVIIIPSIDYKSNEYINNMVNAICLLKLKQIIYIKNVYIISSYYIWNVYRFEFETFKNYRYLHNMETTYFY